MGRPPRRRERSAIWRELPRDWQSWMIASFVGEGFEPDEDDVVRRYSAEARRFIRGIGVAFLLLLGAQSALGAARVLATSDVVSIRIVGQPELDTTTRVAQDGTIAFPYLGRIKAAGLTEDQLERAIARRLVELRILADP